MKFLLSALFLINASHSFSCENGFFPHNELSITTDTEKTMVNHIETAEIVKAIETIYNPLFAKENKKLTINFKWEETAVNAYASTDDSNNPVINITGGMINHELLSQDGLALILCHEIGHFLGGEPKKLRGNSTKKSWSSAEGQADYYATAKCASKVLTQISEKLESKNKSSASVKSEQHVRAEKEANSICKTEICKRVAMASLNVAEVFAAIDFYNNDLSFLYKDDYMVYQTIYGHPNPQCRLDTMVAALQCPDADKLSFKNNDPISGACSVPEYRRPRCWYYPTTSF